VPTVGRKRRRGVRINWWNLTKRSEINEDMVEGDNYKREGISNID